MECNTSAPLSAGGTAAVIRLGQGFSSEVLFYPLAVTPGRIEGIAIFRLALPGVPAGVIHRPHRLYALGDVCSSFGESNRIFGPSSPQVQAGNLAEIPSLLIPVEFTIVLAGSVYYHRVFELQ
jgi:hypothetical protein